jgi:hypothetical protein
MDTTTWVVIVAAVLVVVAIALAVTAMMRARRTRHLRGRFGSEYDRAVASADGRRAAERELDIREKRHDELTLRPLSEASRRRFEQEWADVQGHFVDRPQVAIDEAEQLVVAVMRERGYQADDFDASSDLVSVDHPDIVENYRQAHSISQRSTAGTASTEDLRQAVVAYRTLFESLLVEGADTADRS